MPNGSTSNSQAVRPTIYVSQSGQCTGSGLYRYVTDLSEAEQQAVRSGHNLIVRHPLPSGGTINNGTHWRQVYWLNGRYKYGLSSFSDAEIEAYGGPVPEPQAEPAPTLTAEQLAEISKRKQAPLRDGCSDK